MHNISREQPLFLLLGPSNLYRVNGLMAKTFYHFRARSRNLAGYSDHSNMIYLQTSAPHAVGELLGSASTSSAQTVILKMTHFLIITCSIAQISL